MKKEEVKFRENIFLFKLNDSIKEKDGYLKTIRKISRKYTKLEDLLKDKDYLGLVKLGIILNVEAKHNLIATTGRSVFSERLAGGTTYTGEITYGALGDGSTPFTNASTKLNNEIYRKIPSSQAFDNNIAYIDWFIATIDTPNDTFEEFGTFIDGTASVDSGQAFSLLITGGWVKSGSIFISAQYTIN